MLTGLASGTFGILLCVDLLIICVFLFFSSELWLVIVSLIVLGASVSLALVPTFDKILEITEYVCCFVSI